MSYGMEVFNAAGDRVLHADHRFSQLYVTLTGTSPTSGLLTIPVPGVDADGTWMAMNISPSPFGGQWSGALVGSNEVMFSVQATVPYVVHVYRY